ncbi:MAG TPA: protein kinase [Gammaproteobacteria bacterium]|nr:protein kinase [Gammaproteobacteria bacterium]
MLHVDNQAPTLNTADREPNTAPDNVISYDQFFNDICTDTYNLVLSSYAGPSIPFPVLFQETRRLLKQQNPLDDRIDEKLWVLLNNPDFKNLILNHKNSRLVDACLLAATLDIQQAKKLMGLISKDRNILDKNMFILICINNFFSISLTYDGKKLNIFSRGLERYQPQVIQFLLDLLIFLSTVPKLTEKILENDEALQKNTVVWALEIFVKQLPNEIQAKLNHIISKGMLGADAIYSALFITASTAFVEIMINLFKEYSGQQIEQENFLSWCQKNISLANDLGGERAVQSLRYKRQNAEDQLQVKVNIIPLSELQIGDKIGEGGFSKVFLGKYNDKDNKYNGPPVAIKKLYPSNNKTDDIITRIVKEERNKNRFNKEISVMLDQPHPYLITAYGMAREVETPYQFTSMIVMEYMDKGSLYDVLYRSTESIDLAFYYRAALAIAQGLDHLHGYDIIHRDIKSHNVLLNSQGKIKLADFGLTYSPHKATPYAASEVGRAGTLLWSAPENLQINVIPPTKASDVFSFGILLMEILTRQLPFWYVISSMRAEKKNEREISAQIFNRRRNYELGVSPGYDVTGLRFINICCHADPTFRPTTSQIINKLREEERLSSEPQLTSQSQSVTALAPMRAVQKNEPAFANYSLLANSLFSADPKKLNNAEILEEVTVTPDFLC